MSIGKFALTIPKWKHDIQSIRRPVDPLTFGTMTINFFYLICVIGFDKLDVKYTVKRFFPQP